jgi:hypothetical protein
MTRTVGPMRQLSFGREAEKRWRYSWVVGYSPDSNDVNTEAEEHVYGNISFENYSWKSTFIQVLKMSSMRFNARLCTSHHGPLHPFKDGDVIADSMTVIHSEMCLFVVNRSCIHKGFLSVPTSKSRRIRVRWSWRPCSGPPLPIHRPW